MFDANTCATVHTDIQLRVCFLIFLTEDIAQNLYHDRDFRRKYPQTDVITQQYLTELLLASPNEDGTKR